MIRLRIEIDAVSSGGNEFGVGVLVHNDAFRASEVTDGEGATFIGICMAINEYMRSRGSPDFDCLRERKVNA